MSRPVKRILMIYPRFPKNFWGMHYSLPMIGKKTSIPPLGLITIAALTPPCYEMRLINMNFQTVTDEDLAWADLFCFSAILIQKESLFEAAQRCRRDGGGKPIVFGGPYPTSCPEECGPYCDSLVLDEGEMTWPAFLKDLEEDRCRKIYRAAEKPDITQTPVPRFDLLNVADYLSMSIQFSRGCPFLCEFCDITVLFGRRPRTKTPEQMIRELEALYKTGYRGFVFMVDDNFIGNKKEVKKFLPVLRDWNKARGYPFYYGTEASVNLSDDRELLRGMVESLFVWVYVGLESPSEDSLRETKKLQNIGGSLVDRVKIIQNTGLIVWGGFVVGFDSDKEDIFDRQIEFIREAAIPIASVAVLYALPGTPLHARMKLENRLLFDEELMETGRVDMAAGNSRPEYTNIRTRIPREEMINGYFRVMRDLYTPANYFDRALQTLCRQPRPRSALEGARKAVWLGGILSKNFSMEKLPSGAVHRPSAASKIGFFYQECTKLPDEFKKATRRFIWQVLRKCPYQAMWIIPYVLMGIHYYRFTFEDLLPAGEAESLNRLHWDSQPRERATASFQRA